MQSHTFLTAVRDEALASLPVSLREMQSRIHYGMLQLHFGEPRIHYEVWLVRKTGRIEIGLHFEADREVNHARAADLCERALELREFLGPVADVEEWSPSWTRLHLTLPLGPLDSDLSSEVAERLGMLISLTGEDLLNPTPRSRGQPPSTAHERGRHWRRRRSVAAGAVR